MVNYPGCVPREGGQLASSSRGKDHLNNRKDRPISNVTRNIFCIVTRIEASELDSDTALRTVSRQLLVSEFTMTQSDTMFTKAEFITCGLRQRE